MRPDRDPFRGECDECKRHDWNRERDSFTVAGSVITVHLTGVANVQKIVLTLAVNDGINSVNVLVPMGMLMGNWTGNRSVNTTDIGEVKSHSGAVRQRLPTSDWM